MSTRPFIGIAILIAVVLCWRSVFVVDESEVALSRVIYGYMAFASPP